jgi:hypothetical protein
MGDSPTLRKTLRFLSIVTLISLGSSLPSSWAAPSSDDRVQATALFKEGRRLMQIQQFAQACEKFEASQKLDPGGGTLLNLASCHEKIGKIATAWTEFSEALGIAKRDGRNERIKLASQHIADLEPKLPKIRILVPSKHRLEGLEIKRDGSVVFAAAWGSAIPVDMGTHNITATAPGYKSWASSVEIEKNGQLKDVEIPMLTKEEAVLPPPTTTAASSSAPPLASTVAPPTAPPPSSGNGQAVLGWVLGGVGVIGLGVGSVFGLRAISKRSESNKGCSPSFCSESSVSFNNQAKSAADISTISMGVGLVSLGVGIVLLLTNNPTPSSESATLRVVPHWNRNGAGLSGVARF